MSAHPLGLPIKLKFVRARKTNKKTKTQQKMYDIFQSFCFCLICLTPKEGEARGGKKQVKIKMKIKKRQQEETTAVRRTFFFYFFFFLILERRLKNNWWEGGSKGSLVSNFGEDEVENYNKPQNGVTKRRTKLMDVLPDDLSRV